MTEIASVCVGLVSRSQLATAFAEREHTRRDVDNSDTETRNRIAERFDGYPTAV